MVQRLRIPNCQPFDDDIKRLWKTSFSVGVGNWKYKRTHLFLYIYSAANHKYHFSLQFASIANTYYHWTHFFSIFSLESFDHWHCYIERCHHLALSWPFRCVFFLHASASRTEAAKLQPAIPAPIFSDFSPSLSSAEPVAVGTFLICSTMQSIHPRNISSTVWGYRPGSWTMLQM